MLFNSLDFFIFLPIVFFLYWFVFKGNLRGQNVLILIASYVFYGLWDWRFLSLILLSSIVDYVVGIKIHSFEEKSKRKLWLWVSVIFNVGLLGFFKYYNFFVDSWIELVSFFGYEIKSSWTLNVILPVGISFYTFQTMSYSFDIYYKKLSPTKDFISFATFVAFFPQLVAGPIERASQLLPQIQHKRTFKYSQAVEGIKLILWGLFKKVVIADSIGPLVDDIFSNYSSYSSSTLVLGAIFFSFQIYGDFSGYSDIAIGTAKLFGIELMSNFKFPYFSRNIAEFWRRWHISLSSWFQAYIYIPLGGSRNSKFKTIINVCIVFLVSGFWHGANWTFILWGFLHALIFIPLVLSNRNTKYKSNVIAEHNKLPSIKELFDVLFVFITVTFFWIFFRAESIREAFAYIQHLFTDLSYQVYKHPMGYRMIDYYLLFVLFVFYEFLIRKNERSPFEFKSRVVRFIIYTAVVLMMLLFYDDGVDRSFIYFQF